MVQIIIIYMLYWKMQNNEMQLLFWGGVTEIVWKQIKKSPFKITEVSIKEALFYHVLFVDYRELEFKRRMFY